MKLRVQLYVSMSSIDWLKIYHLFILFTVNWQSLQMFEIKSVGNDLTTISMYNFLLYWPHLLSFYRNFYAIFILILHHATQWPIVTEYSQKLKKKWFWIMKPSRSGKPYNMNWLLTFMIYFEYIDHRMQHAFTSGEQIISWSSVLWKQYDRLPIDCKTSS